MLTPSLIDQARHEFEWLLASCTTLVQAEDLKNQQLGKQGLIADWYKELARLDVEWKKNLWPVITDYKTYITDQLDTLIDQIKTREMNTKLGQEVVDFSMKATFERWYENLIIKELSRMISLFAKYGFQICDGDEIVSKYQNFYSVNIPATHPATQIHDTLYVKQTDINWEPLLLRTHTSSMQQELISKLGPECKFVVPGRTYRAENMDATHDIAFWQVEWVSISRTMNLPQFTGDLKMLLSEIFEMDIEMRLRPWYFPFTEPSFEVDIDCRNNPELFALSKNRWRLEVLGCGMIHPQVLINAWVDPTQYTGYAFWFGLTRMIAIKYGIKDIRLLTNGDLRFVKSMG